jgi:hypothetical protein
LKRRIKSSLRNHSRAHEQTPPSSEEAKKNLSFLLKTLKAVFRVVGRVLLFFFRKRKGM